MIRTTLTGRCACLGVVLMLLAWRAASPTPAAAHAADESLDDAARVEFFEKKVRPLLVARCHECHGHEKPKGNLRLDSRAGALAGGDSGPAVVPGKPDESLLVDAIRYGDTYQMPPKSQLPPEEIATLVEWVRLGAPWGIEAAPTATGQGERAGRVRSGSPGSALEFSADRRFEPAGRPRRRLGRDARRSLHPGAARSGRLSRRHRPPTSARCCGA